MPSSVRRLAGWGVLLAGTSLLIDAAVIRRDGQTWQSRAREQGVAALPPVASGPASPRPPGATTPRAPRSRNPRVGEALARIRLDRLGIDAMVAEGTDPRTLRLGPGHMQGSALPGEPDNCIIAGHRDGVFGRLGGVKAGDRVLLENAAGASRYRVVDVEVVDKDDARLLNPSRDPQLTLVTCYPFHYIGHAPKRFVVRAELQSEPQR